MKRTVHMHVDCAGALRRPEDFVGAITVDGKVLETVQEIKEFFKSQLALGHQIIPCGDCDNFDWETGCRGHEVEEKVEK